MLSRRDRLKVKSQILVSFIDAGVHAAILRLSEMLEAVGTFFLKLILMHIIYA
jgi:hypothetical protein